MTVAGWRALGGRGHVSLAGALALLLLAGAVHGQQVDSAEVRDSFLEMWGVRPNYASRVNVNRTTTDWDQLLKVNRQAAMVNLTTELGVTTSSNSAQNDSKRRDGRIVARLEYGLAGQGGVSAGAEMTVRRSYSSTNINRVVSNDTNARLFVSDGHLGALASRAFGAAPENVTWTVTASTGLTSSRDISQLWNTEGIATRDDSTEADGSNPALETQLKLIQGQTLKFDLTGRVYRLTEDSHTFLKQFADSTESAPNNSQGRRFAAAGTWTPSKTTRVALTGNYNKDTNQYYYNYGGELRGHETKDGTDQSLALDVTVTPRWGVELGMTGSSSLSDARYELGSDDRARRRTSGDLDVKFTTGPVFGFLDRIESNTTFTTERSRNTTERSADYTSYRKSLKQTLRRPMGSKVVVFTTAETSLDQSKYDDGSADKDVLRWYFDTAIGYRPVKKIESRLLARYDETKTANIPGRSAASSNELSRYLFGGEVSYLYRPDLKVTQKYSITADYTVFGYDENRNQLVRTTEVRTTLTSLLGTRIRCDLAHVFRYKDSGKYVRQLGQERAYAKSTKETYQTLDVTTGYNFSESFELHATQKAEITRTRLLTTNNTTTREKYEFRGGFTLNHQFSPRFSVNSDAERVLSTAEDNYWTISASLNRIF